LLTALLKIFNKDSFKKSDYEIIGMIAEGLITPLQYEKTLDSVLSNRLDIQIVKRYIEEAKNVLKLEKSRVFSDVEVGAIYEKEIDGEKSIGVEIGMQLPIFHQNQAQIAMAEFRLRQTEKILEAKVNEVKEEILVILERMTLLSQKINIMKNQILPVRKSAFEFANRYFNAMELNMLYLLEAQKRYLESRRDYLMTLKEYYEEMIGLERVTGDILVK
jgi:cobalt-zinc-cadmium efflux system outer membrane protein